MATQTTPEAWPPGVASKLKTYVYRLVDPRDGQTFYVGKGTGNRVFAHVHAKLPQPEQQSPDNKIALIHDIRNVGLEVGHVIHRHGMDDKTARIVEAALIEAYPGLANRANPPDGDLGVMHALEIIRQYAAQPAVFKHKALMINVNQSAAGTDYYDATHYAWKLSLRKAEQAEVVLTTLKGLIVAAFVPTKWLPATRKNFHREPMPGRIAFVGDPAPASIRNLYVGKRVPDKYRKPGASNPVRYTFQ